MCVCSFKCRETLYACVVMQTFTRMMMYKEQLRLLGLEKLL